MRRFLRKRFAAASLLGGACPPTRSPPSSVNPSSRGRPTVASSMNSGHRNLWESGAANRPHGQKKRGTSVANFVLGFLLASFLSMIVHTTPEKAVQNLSDWYRVFVPKPTEP
jgi:hypothetical protein